MKKLEGFTRIMELPEGERIVAMTIWRDIPIVATERRMFQLIDAEMRPVVFIWPNDAIDADEEILF